MDQIQAMRIFVRIVELGSFSRAAEKLQLPRATVSHTLKRLEQRLGVRLLVRTTRQVNITAEGTLYYQRCLQLLSSFWPLPPLTRADAKRSGCALKRWRKAPRTRCRSALHAPSSASSSAR